MVTSKVTFALDLDLSYPTGLNCRPIRINNQGTDPNYYIRVSFYLSISEPQTIWSVSIKQNGIETVLTSGQNSNSFPFDEYLNLNKGYGYVVCFNQPAQIIVRAADDYNNVEESRLVIYYHSNTSGILSSCSGILAKTTTGKTVTEIDSRQGAFSGVCGPFFGNCLQYPRKCQWTVNHPSNKKVEIVNEYSNGYSLENANPQTMWGTSTYYGNYSIITTYVYYAYNYVYGYFWTPCEPNDAAVTYRIVDKPINTPPFISTITQNKLLTPNSSATFEAFFSQGDCCNLNCTWTVLNAPSGYSFNIVPTGNNNRKAVLSCPPSDNSLSAKMLERLPPFMVQCVATNSYGTYTKTQPVSFSPYSGCPILIVKDDNDNLIADNNLLHKSLLSANYGNFITDKYILKTKPNLTDNKIYLELRESDYDSTVINSIKLYAVQYPTGFKMFYTENGSLGMFDSSSVVESKITSLYDPDFNYTDVTDDLAFHNQSRNDVMGDSLYNIYAEFQSASLSNPAIIAYVRRNIGIQPIIKNDYSGLLIGNTSSGPYQTYFMRRENPDNLILPIPSNRNNVDSAHIIWDKSFDIDYLAIAPISYSGFTLTEFPIELALHSENGLVSSNLLSNDSLYTYISPNSYLMLEFQNLIDPASIDASLDYIIEINGKIVPLSGSMIRTNSNSLISNNVESFSLSQNYPNPFNPVTKINFSIPKQSFVTLKIYDVLGRLVKTLVSERKESGEYTVAFDASNLSSGVYFYRLDAGNYSDVKRMVLLK